MEANFIKKPAFAVIGKQGSTEDGPGFIQALWEDANAHFDQVEALAKRDEKGRLAGVWGLMSDRSLSFHPWEENLTKGLYLAGVEVEDAASPPEGWVKWVSPAYEYMVVESGQESLSCALKELDRLGLSLAGAIYDHTSPETGEGFQYLPIRRL